LIRTKHRQSKIGATLIKDILVHVDTAPECDARVALAAAVAKRLQADLAAIFALPPPDLATWATGPTLKALELELVELEASAVAAEAQFTAMLRKHSLRGRWLLERGSPADCVIRRSRAADLVVLGQRNPDRPQALEAPENVIMACGRPVLMVPYIGSFMQTGDRPLLAWNDSRESRRAVRDALPLMTGKKPATIIWVKPEQQEGKTAIADLAEYLGRYGLKAESELVTDTELKPAEEVLARATDLAADLIVMGADGHSRAREIVLGGMTQDILRQMTVPVLMAH
jgi:nucleotide-binding universal stress UspA family protein